MSFPRYPKYKASGVEWIGEVPAHWEVVKLRHLVSKIEQGWSPQCEGEPVTSSDQWGVLKVGCVNGGVFDPAENKALPAGLAAQPDLGIRRGDILISRANTRDLVGSVAVPEADHPRLMLCDKLYRLRLREKATSAFVQRLLQSSSSRSRIELAASGASASMVNISQEVVLQMECAMPSMSEQVAIAAFLDRETAKIDALVAEQQRLIELLKEKRQAVISHAVTKGLDPNAKMKPSGIEWLGDVPAHWEVKRLRQVAEIRTGVAKGKDLGGVEALEVPYLRVANVQDGFVVLDEVATMPVPKADLARLSLRRGDVLMNEGGDFDKLGRGCVWDGQINPCITQNHVFAVRPHSASSEWVSMFTCSQAAQFFFMSMAKQSTNLASISSSNLMELPLPIPERGEQLRIVKAVEVMKSESDQLVAEAERAITLLQERRTALISAAVTGQIDVRSIELRGSLEGTAGSKNDDASLTISEAAFEAFCTDASIPFVRIPRKQNERTADYLVNSGAQQFVVELKQFDPNEEEQAAIAARAEGKVVAQGGEPGSRIRLAIQNAAPQLRLSSAGRLPAVLVVYNCTGVNMHTDAYSVATAMQGLDVIDIAVPVGTSESPKFGPPRSGPKKKMTANSHTSISAIAVLGYNLDGSMRLDVFHNRHAKNPLDPDMLRGQRVHHWRLPDGARSSLVEWDPV